MILKIITFLLPAAALSKLTVNIEGCPVPKVEATGSDTNIISDAERSTFRIHDRELRDAINTYHGGQVDEAFLRGPTPWGDLYQRYNWSQVERTVIIKGAKLIDNQSDMTVIGSKNFYNRSPHAANVTATVTQPEENTIDHFWTKTGYIILGYLIDYHVKAGIDGSTSFSSKSPFEEENLNTIPATLGSSSSVNVTLQPGQTGVAVLVAAKGKIHVEVEYEASLKGQIAANYKYTYEGHHFWGYDVNTVLKAGKIPETVTWKENVRVNYFANERILVYDLNGTPLN